MERLPVKFRAMTRLSGLAMCVLAGFVSACSTLGDDLRRADELYRQARYESAEAWTRALQMERRAMTPSERLRFEYLRGMCAYRLGRHEEALHSLLLAQVLVADHPDGLQGQDKALLARIVAERVGAANAVR